MSARTEMLAQWNSQKMRTGEKVNPPVLLAVPVYAALKLSKSNVRNTDWDVKCADIYAKHLNKVRNILESITT